MKTYLQKLGQSVMLPVSILPVAALFMGIGYWIDPNVMVEGSGTNSIAIFLIQAGLALIDQLPILFAVGIATGIAKDNNGAAALSGLAGFLMITHLLNPNQIAAITGTALEDVDFAFGAIRNVFIGIVSGVTAGELYNRYSNTKLPAALAFFSGRRFVPILTAGASVIIALILFFIWPIVYSLLVNFGSAISGLGALGAGLYGLFNRLLIPTGLHHALNQVFWFDMIGINDIGNFWASTGQQGVTGMYQAGYFPVMMFGLPAAAFAMYKNARPENKVRVGSIMLAGAFAAFFTGITEPLEFAFMFASPILYLVHAVLTGLSLFIAATLQWTAGFAFSAGLIDFVLSLRVPISNQPLMLMVLGVIMAVIYYFVFDIMIRKFNLTTPGREDIDINAVDSDHSNNLAAVAGSSDYAHTAREIYEAVGGAANITAATNCSVRLRLQLKDSDLVDEKRIRATNVSGVNKIDKRNYQVIVGTDVQFVADEFKKLYNTGA